ncbi:unnamed protein product [Cuscuta europaea]|uniref:Uncharacterized protein n=1 Tax=Cuscuta europaea TaxID=41803 RepID=A0A9P0YYJ1_CUSEU|nr:unnamed protein product [Cuscuta europaea]
MEGRLTEVERNQREMQARMANIAANMAVMQAVMQGVMQVSIAELKVRISRSHSHRSSTAHHGHARNCDQGESGNIARQAENPRNHPSQSLTKSHKDVSHSREDSRGKLGKLAEEVERGKVEKEKCEKMEKEKCKKMEKEKREKVEKKKSEKVEIKKSEKVEKEKPSNMEKGKPKLLKQRRRGRSRTVRHCINSKNRGLSQSQEISSGPLASTQVENLSSQSLFESPESHQKLVNQQLQPTEVTHTYGKEESKKKSSVNLGLEDGAITRFLICNNTSSLKNSCKDWSAFKKYELPSSDKEGWNQRSRDDVLVDAGADFVFSAAKCCLVYVLLHSSKDCAILKITWGLPLSVSRHKVKMDFPFEKCTVTESFWWGISMEVVWWNDMGSTQSVAEGGIVLLKSIMVVNHNSMGGKSTGVEAICSSKILDEQIKEDENPDVQDKNTNSATVVSVILQGSMKIIEAIEDLKTEENESSPETIYVAVTYVNWKDQVMKLIYQKLMRYWEGRSIRMKRKQKMELKPEGIRQQIPPFQLEGKLDFQEGRFDRDFTKLKKGR